MTLALSAWALGIAWLFGGSAHAAYTLLASYHCWRRIRTTLVPAEQRLETMAVDVARRLRIRRSVRLWVTRAPLGPLTFGCLRPTIVVPQALAAHRSTDDLEPLLAHELVHVRRGDALVGLLQAAVQCLWWFHPLIRWANHQIVFERERCCDEEVVADLAIEPARYARGLLSVLELKRQLRWLATVPGARPFEINQRRLEHIMSRGDRFQARTPRAYWLTLIALVFLVVPGAGLTGSIRGVADAQPGLQSHPFVGPDDRPGNATPEQPGRDMAADDFAPLTDAEMHVIGVELPKNGVGKDTGRVDVEVRPTPKPVVLVLTSYYSVDWHVKLGNGARIKQVIVSGYFAQELIGLPPSVPVVNRSYFPEDGSRRQKGWFWAHRWNTPQWREVMRRLNEMTGLPVASFQAQSDGDSFIVDGKRGRNLAQQTLRPRAPAPRELTPQELRAISALAELHVVGMYSPDMNDPGKPVEVAVQATTRPVVLVLTSYMEAVWNVSCADGARIQAVIVGSGFPQEVDGLPAGVPVYRADPDARSYFFDRTQSQNARQPFYAYQWNTREYRRMVEHLNDLTGLLVASFQGESRGKSFVVDGTRGRNYAQKERRPRPALPKAVKAEELLAASVGTDLHVVGIYAPGAGNGAPVDVEVLPTGKPMVLALASYGSALWNVKIAKDARVKAVIIGGYYEQEVEGIPAGIPVAYQTYVPSLNDHFFYGYKWTTLEYRRMVERLNDMTGLLVCTFQGENSGSSFVVDGTRGREYAQKERKPRRAPPKALKPEDLLAACADANLHVVSIYWTGPGNNGTPVDVDVRPTKRPIVLALASYQSVLWKVRMAQGARVNAVIVGGYSEQEAEGLSASIPILYRTYFPSLSQGFFYGHQWNSPECQDMVKKLHDLTGLRVAHFQGEELGSSFVVEDARGRSFFQTERAVDQAPGRENVRNQPDRKADPSSDVADIPSQELQAGGDADKRYFLIGPKKNPNPPAEGYGLLVIIPGGDGSAEFHPFVKRIYEHAVSERYVAAQPIAVRWTAGQQIVWPTKANPVARMKFGTTDFLGAVIEDVAKRHKLDRNRVFSLSWSSSGPAAYAASLQKGGAIVGSFIAMSVFNPKLLPPLKEAEAHAYYLYHSPQDRVCPYRMAEQARNSLGENGAKVRLQTYEGGHGWRGNVYNDIRNGLEWLEEARQPAAAP
jgi:beta-lactamase regulating signal transducer with metallopeptidase domain/predicted esterase